MSRTYRKYPTYYYLSGGIKFTDWDDIPTIERWYEYRTNPKKKSLIRVWYDGYTKNGALYTYFKMEEVVEYDYSVTISTWQKYEERAPCEVVGEYDKKTPDGLRGRSLWSNHGVGKENKRIRKKKHRAEARHIIDRWMQDDFDCDIPVEKNHDRWDAW